MFGHHYFPARFFTDYYFGDGGPGPYPGFSPANTVRNRILRVRVLAARRRGRR